MRPQIIINLTINHKPTNLISIILVYAKVLNKSLGNIGKCGLGMDLKATTRHCETLESNFLLIGPAKASRLFVLPSNSMKTWWRGSSFVCKRQTTFCSGLWRAFTNFLIQPLLMPVITAPSVPMTARFSSKSVPLITDAISNGTSFSIFSRKVATIIFTWLTYYYNVFFQACWLVDFTPLSKHVVKVASLQPSIYTLFTCT